MHDGMTAACLYKAFHGHLLVRVRHIHGGAKKNDGYVLPKALAYEE
jgi:hypothetical protein